MMKQLCIFLMFLSKAIAANATNSDLAVDKINAALLQHAWAITRYQDNEVEINSTTDVTYRYHYAITVLNEQAAELANFEEHFSTMQRITKLSGCIYDANGREIRRLKDNDFWTRSAMVGYAAYYDDDKIRGYTVDIKQYPYTVEYSVVIKYSQTFQLPDLDFQPMRQCAVEHASAKVAVADGLQLKYKLFRVTDNSVSKSEGKNIYIWSVQNIKAQKPEALVYQAGYDLPSVLLSLSDFEVDGYKGSTTDWKSFGQFVYELNKGRDILPADMKTRVQEMIAGAKTVREKVDTLYRYLQRNTRYVSIQYGIGGWQTLDADFLSKNKYGDCKALTNYMMAMLKEAGVESYATLVYAGREYRELVKDFPGSQFNHVILNVPDNGKNIWLECTSQDLPSNYLSDFTEDRDALMITPDGGKLVHTPCYGDVQNTVSRHAYVDVGQGNVIQVKLRCAYTGLPALHVFDNVNNESRQKIEDYASKKYHLSSYKIANYKFNRSDAPDNLLMDEQADFTANGLVNRTNSYVFVNMDVAPIGIPELVEAENRIYPFYLSQSINICDTFELNIPETVKIESLPPRVESAFPFGNFYCEVKNTGKKLVYTRRFMQKKGIYPADIFSKYEKWLEDVHKESGRSIVFKSL